MASPFAPEPEEDDEQPGYYGAAAALLPKGTPPPVNIPYLPQDQQPAAPAGPPTAPQTMAPGQAQRPAVVLPTAPTAPSMDMAKYEAMVNQKAADGPKQVAPKWWERLAGAGVGFGVGFKEGPSAGIRAGGAVTRRGQVAEDEAASSRLAADDTQIQGLQREQDMSRKDYENQVTQFNASLSKANAERGQQNADRSFDRDTANDTYTHGRDDRNDARSQSNADRQFEQEGQFHGDTVAQQQAQLALERARLGEEGRHNRVSEANTAEGHGNAGTGRTTITPDRWQGLLTTRDKEYAEAQKAMRAEMAADPSPEAQAAVKQKYDGLAASLQDRWNSRLSTADPEGKYATTGGDAPPATAPSTAQPSAAPAQSKRLTNPDIARGYLKQAGGDKVKARALAAKDGYAF